MLELAGNRSRDKQQQLDGLVPVRRRVGADPILIFDAESGFIQVGQQFMLGVLHNFHPFLGDLKVNYLFTMSISSKQKSIIPLFSPLSRRYNGGTSRVSGDPLPPASFKSRKCKGGFPPTEKGGNLHDESNQKLPRDCARGVRRDADAVRPRVSHISNRHCRAIMRADLGGMIYEGEFL